MSDIDIVEPVAGALDQNIGSKNKISGCLHGRYYNSRKAVKKQA